MQFAASVAARDMELLSWPWTKPDEAPPDEAEVAEALAKLNAQVRIGGDNG